MKNNVYEKYAVGKVGWKFFFKISPPPKKQKKQKRKNKLRGAVWVRIFVQKFFDTSPQKNFPSLLARMHALNFFQRSAQKYVS